MALKVVELRALLRARGLPVSGNKAALEARLAKQQPKDAVSAAPLARSVDAIPADPTPPPTLALPDKQSLNVASWNVAGLRALLRNERGVDSLRQLVTERRTDVLLLQETKLQESNVAEVEDNLLGVLGSAGGVWRAAWSCSTARKGYSGVATLWRTDAPALGGPAECEPLAIDPEAVADREGRTLLLSMPARNLSIVNVYTPNSGSDLSRLGYRCDEWDVRFRQALMRIQECGTQLCVGGDLNVAGEDVDFFNPRTWSEIQLGPCACTQPCSAILTHACSSVCIGCVPIDCALLADKRLARMAGTTNPNALTLTLNLIPTLIPALPLPYLTFPFLTLPYLALPLAPDEKRMARQAGTTPQERASFRSHLAPPLSLLDAFRTVHPQAKGQYTYWSQRARNRPRNRGLRLDYFLLSAGLSGAVHDVQHLHGLHGSDHCPVLFQMDLARVDGSSGAA